MARPDGTSSATLGKVRPPDRQLLDLEEDPDDPDSLSLVVVPKLCRTDGRFYGGAALAATLAAIEGASGRDALWATAQLVAPAAIGERVRIVPEVLASGRSVDQVAVRGWVGDRLLFNSVGSASSARPDGLAGAGQVMPNVPPPQECGPWRGPDGPAPSPRPEVNPARLVPTVGHHLVTDHRDAPILDRSPDRPGQFALWGRLSGDLSDTRPTITPAILGFLADLVPLAVCRACGVSGAGTSLDNSIRIGDVIDTEWVLVDLDASVAAGGFGHGTVNLWSSDGRMLATGSQSARLFTMDDFFNRPDRKG